jgi:hypothetical protein
VERLAGDIPAFRNPAGWDPTTPVNIIIATDGSVSYHSWVVATEDEDILLQGGGPDDGDLFLMQSYRSELGGGVRRSISPWNSHFCATMSRLSYQLTGHSTINDLQENWCYGLDIAYDWVK